MESPIRYARSDGVNIAYQVTGAGAFDLVLVPGFFSHVEVDWEHPEHARFLHRLGSFARLIRFDKRGTGLSDRLSDLPDFETRMEATSARSWTPPKASAPPSSARSSSAPGARMSTSRG